ncbi:MAG: YpdA family putative bacillithiol disulfide reductase [bacterium]|nr:YpdA family putative bacillithiol disulfide reductase [bacterium]
MPVIECDWPLIIVGSGPAGIGVALEAKRRGVRALLLDRGCLCNTIYNFPDRMLFFSTADLLEFSGIPLVAEGAKPSRREVLDYFTRIVLSNNLPFLTDCEVKAIVSSGQSKVVRTSQGDFTSNAVVLATGSYDKPNLLNVPGESLPHVSHYYSDAHPFIGKDVVIVGGKNSAAESALELLRSGARVTLIHRGKTLSPSIKYWIRPDLDNRIREGNIMLHLNSRIVEIRKRSVLLDSAGVLTELPADAAFLLTGYNPDYNWLRTLGLEFEGDAELPMHDPDTLVTNVPGIYVAGVLIAGRETSRVFIENSRTHGEKILAHYLSISKQ